VAFLPTMWALIAPGVSGFGCLTAGGAPEEKGHETDKSRLPAPTFSLLGHALFQCSLSFFLFSFQVHEKSILVPLLPITILMAASAPTVEGGDWEWGVLLNNVACFRCVLLDVVMAVVWLTDHSYLQHVAPAKEGWSRRAILGANSSLELRCRAQPNSTNRTQISHKRMFPVH
jgi:hypothetical protein